MNAAIPALCTTEHCATCGHSARLHISYAGTTCQDASCGCAQFMLLGRIQKTGEKNINYDMVKKKYRVVIKGKHVCYTVTLMEAKRRRDLKLQSEGI